LHLKVSTNLQTWKKEEGSNIEFQEAKWSSGSNIEFQEAKCL
jgi:hypothetical protein